VRISLSGVVWIVVGVVVAATHHFFRVLNNASTVGSAILAVIAWPLILLHIHIAI
jgi:ABC-type anion transport system duplicated permease subunit